MSQEPKVTRFGADPTVDQELATKAYVDAGGGSGVGFVIGSFRSGSHGSGALRFWSMIGDSVSTSTENNVQFAVGFESTLEQIFCQINANSLNDVCTCGMRDDGATPSTITIASATTGNFSNTGIGSTVATASLLNWFTDSTVASSGSITFQAYSASLI